MRARRRVTPSRPYMPRLSVFSRLICPLGLPIAPSLCHGVTYGVDISLCRAREGLELLNSGMPGFVNQRIELATISAAKDPAKPHGGELPAKRRKTIAGLGSHKVRLDHFKDFDTCRLRRIELLIYPISASRPGR